MSTEADKGPYTPQLPELLGPAEKSLGTAIKVLTDDPSNGGVIVGLEHSAVVAVTHALETGNPKDMPNHDARSKAARHILRLLRMPNPDGPLGELQARRYAVLTKAIAEDEFRTSLPQKMAPLPEAPKLQAAVVGSLLAKRLERCQRHGRGPDLSVFNEEDRTTVAREFVAPTSELFPAALEVLLSPVEINDEERAALRGIALGLQYLVVEAKRGNPFPGLKVRSDEKPAELAAKLCEQDRKPLEDFEDVKFDEPAGQAAAESWVLEEAGFTRDDDLRAASAQKFAKDGFTVPGGRLITPARALFALMGVAAAVLVVVLGVQNFGGGQANVGVPVSANDQEKVAREALIKKLDAADPKTEAALKRVKAVVDVGSRKANIERDSEQKALGKLWIANADDETVKLWKKRAGVPVPEDLDAQLKKQEQQFGEVKGAGKRSNPKPEDLEKHKAAHAWVAKALSLKLDGDGLVVEGQAAPPDGLEALTADLKKIEAAIVNVAVGPNDLTLAAAEMAEGELRKKLALHIPATETVLARAESLKAIPTLQSELASEEAGKDRGQRYLGMKRKADPKDATVAKWVKCKDAPAPDLSDLEKQKAAVADVKSKQRPEAGDIGRLAQVRTWAIRVLKTKAGKDELTEPVVSPDGPETLLADLKAIKQAAEGAKIDGKTPTLREVYAEEAKLEREEMDRAWLDKQFGTKAMPAKFYSFTEKTTAGKKPVEVKGEVDDTLPLAKEMLEENAQRFLIWAARHHKEQVTKRDIEYVRAWYKDYPRVVELIKSLKLDLIDASPQGAARGASVEETWGALGRNRRNPSMTGIADRPLSDDKAYKAAIDAIKAHLQTIDKE